LGTVAKFSGAASLRHAPQAAAAANPIHVRRFMPLYYAGTAPAFQFCVAAASRRRAFPPGYMFEFSLRKVRPAERGILTVTRSTPVP
jgi:hypothetical protein